MDEVVKTAFEYGLVGAVAVMFGFLYFNERKENKALREQRVIDAAKATPQGQADAFAARVEQISNNFGDKLIAMDLQHHKQEDELTDRLIKTTIVFSEKTGQLVEKAAQLADSVKRHDKTLDPTISIRK